MLRRLFLIAVLGLAAWPAQASSLRGDYLMCRSKADLEKAVRGAAAGNDSVVAHLLGKGACRATAGGVAVKVLNHSASLALVRPKGDKGQYWTVVEAVK